MNPGFRYLSALAGLSLMLGAAPAQADLTACNQTEWDIAVAIGVETEPTSTSYGWWVIAPGICEKLLEADDTKGDIYAYAEHHTVAGSWAGDETFCVDDGQFEISGRDKCRARGYKPVGFFKIDMKPSQDVRYDFVDADK